MYRVNELVNRLREKMPVISHGLFSLEEYILLPYYGGNVMLRFDITRQAERSGLDALERELYRLLPEGVFADFMGGVYRAAGLNMASLAEKSAKCAAFYRDEEIPVSPYRDEVIGEAKRLLRLAELHEDLPVWEIQPDEDETALLILSDRQEVLKRFEADGRLYTVLTVETEPCEGLIKAAAFAKRSGISLLSAIDRA